MKTFIEGVDYNLPRIEYKGDWNGTLNYYIGAKLVFKIDINAFGQPNENELKALLFQHNIKENDFQELLKRDCPFIHEFQAESKRMIEDLRKKGLLRNRYENI
jgi:hypothetical protein